MKKLIGFITILCVFLATSLFAQQNDPNMKTNPKGKTEAGTFTTNPSQNTGQRSTNKGALSGSKSTYGPDRQQTNPHAPTNNTKGR